MTPIDAPADLKKYYEDREVVGMYMRRRTGEPLNGVLHRRQIGFLTRAVAQRAPGAVLEIACGPGRLTAAMRGVRFGVAIDASPVMLETAQRRTNGQAANWSFLRSDAFILPFHSEAFDVVYTLRFIRHFQLDDRQRLYAEVRRVLRPQGILIVDALNQQVSYPYRLRRGLEHYPVYDILYRRDEIEAELRAAGFRVVEVEGILKHASVQRPLNRLRRLHLGWLATTLISTLERVPGRQPSTWMIVGAKS